MREILHINFHEYVAFWHLHDSISDCIGIQKGNMIWCNVIASSKQRITLVLRKIEAFQVYTLLNKPRTIFQIMDVKLYIIEATIYIYLPLRTFGRFYVDAIIRSVCPAAILTECV